MLHAHQSAISSHGIPLILALTAAVYLAGCLKAPSTCSSVVARRRAGSFFAGLFVVWVAVASPVTGYVHELLTVHMAQHLLLMTIAPPLIWLGAPVVAFKYGLPRSLLSAVVSVLRSPSMRWVGTVMSNPVACWLGAALTLIAWHIPWVLMLGVQSESWHAVAQLCFLVTGLLFWWPVVQPSPTVKHKGWLIVFYLFLATVPCDILSGFLVFCDRVVYPVYFSSSHPFGLSPLEDQRYAGALMWTCVTMVYLVAATIVSLRLLSPRMSGEYSISQPNPQSVYVSSTARPSIEVI